MPHEAATQFPAMEIDQLTTEAVKAILIAAAPAGLPSTVSIVAEHDREPAARPYLEVAMESEQQHPRQWRGALRLRLRVRADDQEPATSAAWHRIAVTWLFENSASIAATLAPYGLGVLKFVPRGYDDSEESARGRAYVQEFLIILRAL